jgi:outer membrane protein OmpA-like peptidoglycan-associated protein
VQRRVGHSGSAAPSFGQQLVSAGRALKNETDRREEAEKRAAKAAADLAKFASVKQEARGMVITLSGSVLFATAKADLLPTAQLKLNEVADVLTKQDPDSKLVVEGHTDSQGGAAYNQELSQRRAQSVREYLVSRGIAADRVTAQDFGATRAIADNASAEGRANNRRVEIVVQKWVTRVEQVPARKGFECSGQSLWYCWSSGFSDYRRATRTWVHILLVLAIISVFFNATSGRWKRGLELVRRMGRGPCGDRRRSTVVILWLRRWSSRRPAPAGRRQSRPGSWLISASAYVIRRDEGRPNRFLFAQTLRPSEHLFAEQERNVAYVPDAHFRTLRRQRRRGNTKSIVLRGHVENREPAILP